MNLIGAKIMTTETIEKTRIPGMPDKALIKAANLAEANTRISWMLSDEGSKLTQLLFVDSGMSFEATNNTLLFSAMIDALETKESIIENLQAQIETLRKESRDNE